MRWLLAKVHGAKISVSAEGSALKIEFLLKSLNRVANRVDSPFKCNIFCKLIDPVQIIKYVNSLYTSLKVTQKETKNETKIRKTQRGLVTWICLI